MPTIEKVFADMGKTIATSAQRIRKLETNQQVALGQATLTVTAQSIPFNTDTPIAWDTFYAGSGFSWVIGTPAQIFFAQARPNQRAVINGNILFDTSATGLRQVWLNTYKADTSLRSSQFVGNLLAAAALQTPVPVSLPYIVIDPTDYLEIHVLQTSGGPLNVDAIIGLMLTR